MLSLQNILYQYSKAKIKSGNKDRSRINLIIDITLNYFDKNSAKQSFKVDSFLIPRHLPTSSSIQLENSERLIVLGDYEFLESIVIKVTEINARKKHWDKSIKTYEDNRETAQEILLKIIKAKE